MQVFLLISLSLIPATMVFISLAWRKRPPRKINWIYGYRTDWSMKSQETWDFAHKYFARLWLWIGVPLWLLSTAAGLIGSRYGEDTLAKVAIVATISQCIFIFLPIIPTEMALRRNFDAGGNRKSP